MSIFTQMAPSMKRRNVLFGLGALVVVQVLLFRSFIEREVSWTYILHGDPTWYVFINYQIFEAVRTRNWEVLAEHAVRSPWGIVLFLEALIPQFLFGPSRFSLAFVNLAYYVVAQAFTFLFVHRLTRSYTAGFAALALLLAMQSPFRGDGPGLNIVDFHFDLVLFFLLLIVFYLVGWSNSFARRKPTILVAVLTALTIATRLVSAFVFVGLFSGFLAVLLYQFLRDRADDKSRERLRNFRLLTIVSGSLSAIPLLIGSRALYDHYFRFVFEPAFRETRAGLYTMGSESYIDAAAQISWIMIAWDFGPVFAVAAVFGLAALACARLMIPSSQSSGVSLPTPNHWQLSHLLHDSADRRLLTVLMIVGVVSTFVQHVVFPIKSDHLTRMTAAPLVILILLFVTPALAQLCVSSRLIHRILVVAVVLVMIAAAVITQVGFYSGSGRHSAIKRDALVIQDLYKDLFALVIAQRQQSVAVSVDEIRTYELGALRSFFSYVYEQSGLLLQPIPSLGAIIDEPVTLDGAVAYLQESDYVLLREGSYPQDAGWPFMRAMRPIHSEVRAYADANMCLFQTYYMFGTHKLLYVNTQRLGWTISASESTEPRYGPQTLMRAPHAIWHAPWGDRSSQWVRFDAAIPLRVSGIELEMQDGGPERAPKAFVLQISHDGSNWTDHLRVRDAGFTRDTPRRLWSFEASAPVRHFRIVVTENGGEPTLMTIQKVRFVFAEGCGLAHPQRRV